MLNNYLNSFYYKYLPIVKIDLTSYSAFLVMQSKKKHLKKNIFKRNLVFNVFFIIFYNLKKGKDISMLWSAYSEHTTGCKTLHEFYLY